tara:strand:+ start:2124 stop:3368 length:1245 start_codon:yes stop_codon:yes gene_type:complete
MARSKEDEEQIRKILRYNADAQSSAPIDPSCSSFDEFELSLDPLAAPATGVKKHNTSNVFEGIEFFKAVVAIPWKLPDGRQACKAIVPGLHSCVTNPFLEDSSDGSAQIISKLPTFVSPYQLFSPLVPGSVIEVSFDNPWFYWGSGTILKALLGRPLAMPEWAKDVPGATDLFNDWPTAAAIPGLMIDFLGMGSHYPPPILDPALIPECADGKKANIKRLHQYGDASKNNWRSGQATLEDLKCLIENKGIERIIRMNGDEGSGDPGDDTVPGNRGRVTMAEEKALSVSLNVEWQFIDAHQGRSAGQGYRGSKNTIHPILHRGNSLVHCRNGSDRTGYIVASYLKEYEGETDLEKLYEYTTSLNGWKSVFKGASYAGYAKYLDGFYPLNVWCTALPGRSDKFPNICKNLGKFGYK